MNFDHFLYIYIISNNIFYFIYLFFFSYLQCSYTIVQYSLSIQNKSNSTIIHNHKLCAKSGGKKRLKLGRGKGQTTVQLVLQSERVVDGGWRVVRFGSVGWLFVAGDR